MSQLDEQIDALEDEITRANDDLGEAYLEIAELNEKLTAANALNAELLEALKTLLQGAERHIFGDECLVERTAARAAIAKAEGK